MKQGLAGAWLALVIVLTACGQDVAPEVTPAPQADHVGAAVVISQVYGGGGNSGAPLKNDFVELFNRSGAEQALAGLSLQYASATGTGNLGASSSQLVVLPEATLEPGEYFLVQLAGGSNGEPLPAPDADGTINMAAASGKVALATGTTSLGCNGGSTACSDEQLARIVDLVGFGGANFFEGDAAAPTLSNTTAALRKGEGCTDTDDNAADFASGTPTPHNSSSLVTVCEGSGNGDGDDGGDDGGSAEPTPIYDIQGAGHTSPLVNQTVSTLGIVTAVDSNGFYLQDPEGDGNDATSDAVFVFTSTTRPSVSVGDAATVSGTVSEFQPGGPSSRNLSITQIGSPTVTVTSTDNPLPASVVIGQGGRTPPTAIIDNDNFTVFDPQEDGIDFFESLEGMRVTVSNPVAVSPTNRFGEIFTVTDNGGNATGLSESGTLNISPDDFNPERVQLQTDSGILPGFTMPQVDVGAVLEDVTGVVGYGFGNFEVLVTETFGVAEASSLEPEVTDLTATETGLTVATYNVLNLDPNDADGDADIANGQFSAIAEQIVGNLRAPDILALQEVQDNSGSVNNGVVAADLTYETLIAAITAAGGPTYAFFELPPQNNQDGGQPGGNIRVGFLYNPARVDLLEETAVRIGEGSSAFDASRKSLAADFVFNAETVTVVNNHFASKGGSSPLFGTLQPSVSSAPGEGQENPAVNGGVDDRRGQAEAVKAYVDTRLAPDADANVVVLGDFNEFEFISPLEILEGSLVNLTETLSENERYSYIFEGNSQSLDHILVSRALAGSEFDAVHVNSEFAVQASDHDPLVTRLEIAPQDPQEALEALQDQVEALSGTLNRGQLRSLQADLDSAERHLGRDQTRQAERSLERFEDGVRRLVRQGALTETQGQPLVDASSAIRAQL